MFIASHQTIEPEPSVVLALAADTANRLEGEVAVQSVLPAALQGVPFRNGPGRFSRGRRMKRRLLNGDGVVQRLAIADGKARYTRRLAQTPKLAAETAADKFLFPTWTSKAPRMLSNMGQHMQSQAGVTAYQVNGQLLALDEVAPGFELDRDTLETRGPAALGLPDHDASPKAHARHIAGSGDWIFASTRMGPKGMLIDFLRRRAAGSASATPAITAPRMSYVHDFGATGRFAVAVLHAVDVHGLRLGAWHPAQRVAALDTCTGRLDAFDFGAHVNAGEPVFAADPAGAFDQGWIITQTLDMRRGKTEFAVLDANRLVDGPVATISIGEAVPISFHGQWVSREIV
jgi:carotenoid cleavage dioxygenase-like enzyme